jgi:dienelactone hydrolase
MKATSMSNRRSLAAACSTVSVAASLLWSPATLAQAPATAATPATPTAPALPSEVRPAAPVFPMAPSPAWEPGDTPRGLGAYPAIMVSEASLPTHTVYRPASLAPFGAAAKLPIVAFANGACVNVGNRFRYFLTEIASQGYLAVAIGPVGPKEAESAASGSSMRGTPSAKSEAARIAAIRKAGDPPLTFIPSDTAPEQMTDAIDWALAESARPGSPYYGKLDPSRIAVMGQSCGGIQAIAAALDPRVKVLAVLNSGLFPGENKAFEMAGAKISKASLAKLHTPALYLSGETSDQAFRNADDDFSRIEHVPVVRLWREKTGHSGTYREPNGGPFGRVVGAWLAWQLKGEAKAGAMFTGPECELCRSPEWHIQKKKVD